MRSRIPFAPVVLALAFAACGAFAQLPVGTPPLQPIIHPARALGGHALVEALRAGGFVLYMRHGKQGLNTEECTQTNLTPEGEAQAKAVGAELKRLKIPIGAIFSSTFCRAYETAQLVNAGPVTRTADLIPAMTPEAHAARMKRIAQPPAPGTNTLLVSHGQSSEHEWEQVFLDLAEVIVYRPDGQGGAQPVARIRLEDWKGLSP